MYKLVKLCLHGDVNVRGHLAKRHYPSCSSQANDNPPAYIVHELHMYVPGPDPSLPDWGEFAMIFVTVDAKSVGGGLFKCG